jgi:chromosome segregation ATPase
MSEDEKTVNALDATIQAAETSFKEFIEVLETSRTALLNLEHDKGELSNEKEKLEAEKIQLELEKSKLETEKMQLEVDKRKLEEATTKLEKEKQERDQKIGSLTEEQVRLIDEYQKVKVELTKFAKLAEEAESQELNFERITALLSIFRVLVEKIWQGQPHYKVLKVLHGEREVMTREELKNTTGIGGAYILRAVQELANVDLVEHDIDTGTVTLKQRLYSKEAMDKK